MPIVISQPAPADSFKSRGNQNAQREFNQQFAQMAGAIQSRYASDRASAGREELGFAQLADDSAFRQQQLQLQAQEIQSRERTTIAAIQERAQMESWLMQQSMTMKEQQEQKQQQNAVVELQELHRKGLITDEEFGLKFHGIKARVDFLGMKEQITKNKMLNEQRQQHAALFKSQMEREGELNKFRGMSWEDRQVFRIDHSQYDLSKKELIASDQNMAAMAQLNAPQFELEVRAYMKRMNRGRHGILQPDGKTDWDELPKTGPGGASSSASGTAKKEFNVVAAKAAAEARADLQHREGTTEWAEAVKKGVAEAEAKHAYNSIPEPERKAMEKKQAVMAETKGKEVSAAEIEGLALDPGTKQAGLMLVSMQKKMIEDFGPYAGMTGPLKEKMDKLASEIAKIKARAGSDRFVVGEETPPMYHGRQ